MAEASTRRFRDGVPLSIFDGVPVGFKEEYSVVSSTKLPSVYFEDSSRGLRFRIISERELRFLAKRRSPPTR